jgi:hypothetical protein
MSSQLRFTTPKPTPSKKVGIFYIHEFCILTITCKVAAALAKFTLGSPTKPLRSITKVLIDDEEHSTSPDIVDGNAGADTGTEEEYRKRFVGNVDLPERE